jgi:hypothetical protein
MSRVDGSVLAQALGLSIEVASKIPTGIPVHSSKNGDERLVVLDRALKHAFWRCLEAAGVNVEDRQHLLRHRSARITTH